MLLRSPLFNYQQSNQQPKTLLTDACRRCPIICVALLMMAGAGAAQAQSLSARVSVVSVAPPRVKIEGGLAAATRVWSFRNVYANVMNLGERIENLKLTDEGGAEVQVRKLAPGEYEAAGPATRFVYEMRLDAPTFEGDAAHVSWLTNDRGFLMLGDLLPVVTGGKEAARASAVVRFDLPERWTAASSTRASADGQFEVADAEAAVFFVGQNLREKRKSAGSMEFAFVTAGEWAFTDEEAAEMAAGILKEHAATFGGAAHPRVMLALAQFPRPAGADRWSAETRGATVTLLAGKSPSKTAALAQLSFPLAHELFHLWIPNGVALDGNYDWFYEGFTLYQALRAAVRLELLTFQDYLNALGRAFDAYKSAPGRERLSLHDASERRWTLSPALDYNK